MPHPPPVVGITVDLTAEHAQVGRGYLCAVMDAGAVPLLLPPAPQYAAALLDRCDAVVFTGGDDPIMSAWDQPMHPKAKPIDPLRQQFELALLEAIDQRPQLPVLGVCLGMQLMGLYAGGRLDQHLPDSLPTASLHWGRVVHSISGSLGSGDVLSHHRQALTDPGRLEVAAVASDGVIEAVRDPARPFYLGVQWHPERTPDASLGTDLFAQLVTHARDAWHRTAAVAAMP